MGMRGLVHVAGLDVSLASGQTYSVYRVTNTNNILRIFRYSISLDINSVYVLEKQVTFAIPELYFTLALSSI